MIDLDGKAEGGVRFMLGSAEALARCRSDEEIEAQADMLRKLIDEVAARMKVELARQKVERQI